MSLSTREIERVVREARPLLAGATLREVAHVDRETFAFRFRCSPGDRYLCLCIDPALARLHLLSSWPAAPKSRHPFYLFLKSHLLGDTLASIEQVPGDRIVELRFAGREPLDLIAELTGSLTNLICVSPQREILEAWRHVRLRDRELFPHVPYQSPPPPSRPSAAASRDRFADARAYSAAVETAYALLSQERRVEQLRQRLHAAMGDSEQKLSRAVLNIERSLQAMRAADIDRQKGELLKAHLAELPRGTRQVELKDETGDTLSIALDPKRSPVDNMRRYFQKYKKAAAGIDETERRLAKTSAEHAHAQHLLELVAAANDLASLKSLEAEMASARLGSAPKRRQVKATIDQPRRFVSADGLELLVGRNNAQNDHLTLHIARGNDLWVHVQTIAGSHVIVRTPPGKSVPKETLLDAATLAVYYSKARHSKGVFVDYVQRKHVRKPKGSRPGYVTYAHNKTITIDPDPERLRRVLAASASAEGD